MATVAAFDTAVNELRAGVNASDMNRVVRHFIIIICKYILGGLLLYVPVLLQLSIIIIES